MSCESSDMKERSAKKKEPGISWMQNEEHVVPKNRLGIVSIALACATFLAVMDLTIVGPALPTIVARLHGGNQYSWIGSSYLLVSGVFSPFYGKLSRVFGQNPLLYSCIITFLLGSALCGAAQSITWLILFRAIQGAGGGGVVQLSMIIISDIVPLEDRGRYNGLLGAAYGIASVAGPPLGGALAEHASWRWCFFINLPIGCIVMTFLFIFLNVHPPEKRPLRDKITELDFIGLFSLTAGIVCLLLGLRFGEESWLKPQPIALIIVGVVLLIVGVVNEASTKRAAILPLHLFKTRTTGVFWRLDFLSTLFTSQRLFLGASTTGAGIKTLPHTLVSSTFAVISGFVATKMGKNRPSICFGCALVTVGMGLLIMLDYTSSLVEQEVFPLVAAIGAGFLFRVPMLALQAAMPFKDMATAASGYMFLHALGGAVGIAICDIIIAIALPPKLAAIPNAANLDFGNTISELMDSVNQVHLIPDVTLRNAVLHAWARSFAVIWMVMTVLAGVALVLTLFLREYKGVSGTETRSMGDTGVGHAEDGTCTDANAEEKASIAEVGA